MADQVLFPIIYTDRSLENAKEIRDYLLYKFTQREVENLHYMLGAFEKIVIVFPNLYPLIANSKKIRRTVLSKQLSVFYTHSKIQYQLWLYWTTG